MSAHRLISFLGLLALACTAACAPIDRTATSPASVASATPTLPLPTASPTPVPWVWLISPAPRPDQEVLQSLEQAVRARGLELVESNGQLPTTDRPPPALIINLSTAPLDPQNAASTQGIPLITVAPEDAQRTSNSTLIDLSLASTHGAFAAGYMSAVLASNYRMAAVGLEDEPLFPPLARAFSEGVTYFCGLCRPASPPFEEYPIIVTLGSEADDAQIAAISQDLANRGVSFVYLTEVSRMGKLSQALADQGIRVLANETPDALQPGALAAVIRPDLDRAVKEALEPALEGEVDRTLIAPIAIDPNPNIVSSARLRLVQSVLEDLRQGYIAVSGP